tara:strand:- start:828 stop:1181 length:354 start_codon:yes stop_codon:yes gene_type:complete
MDRYRIINGKRVKLTAAQKTALEAEELANTPTASKAGYDKAVAKAERSKLGLDDKLVILEEALQDLTVLELAKIKVTDGERVKEFSALQLNNRIKALCTQRADIRAVMIAEIEAAQE